MPRLLIAAIFFTSFTLLASGALAQDAEDAGSEESEAGEVEPAETGPALVSVPDRHRVTYEATMAVRANPLGLFLFGNVGFSERLYRSDSEALAQNFVYIGLAPEISPALARIGLRVDVQPLSVLRLWAIYQYGTYFGNFGYMQSFTSPDADWSDSTLRDLSDATDPADRNYSTSGHGARLGGRFQIKLGGFVLRNTFLAQWSRYDLRDGDDIYYDPIFDVPVANGGWLVANDLDAAWIFGETGWLAGIRYNWTAPIYADDVWDDDPDGTRSHENRIHRLGPLIAHTFEGKEPSVRRPTLLLILNWYLSHRYRTGADVSQAFPYIGVAFLMRGDLWTRD